MQGKQAAGASCKMHPLDTWLEETMKQRSLQVQLHFVSLYTLWVQISNFVSLYLPTTLAVPSCMSLACLCLCHYVHICLSVALLVFKGPEFI